MVLQLGHQDFIAGPQPWSHKGLRHQIDCLGRPAHEDDFIIRSGVHKSRHLAARRFIGQRHFTRKRVGQVLADEIAIEPVIDVLQGDATKAREKLGWRHTTSFPELVREMVTSDIRLLAAERAGQPR